MFNGIALSLAFVDLDKFKQMNDRLGHAGGDSALQATARAMTAHLRGSDPVPRHLPDIMKIMEKPMQRQVLGNGAVPLSVLEKQIREYVASRKQQGQ